MKKQKKQAIKTDKAMINFKKAHSLLAKIMKMSEDKEYCINIMQQNLAVIGLLKSAHHQLMEKHLNHCFKNAMASNNEKLKQQMTEEILKVSKIANK
jgi:DNA-binding FrmR family transcriptional regulator